MNLLEEAGKGHRTFSITFPSGERIPFRLLSWSDFTKYWQLSQKATVPNDIVEDAIFRKCCIDQICIDNIHEMRAGIITTVVGLIMQMSGPIDLSRFNTDMDIARSMVDTLDSQILMIICRAFPAYKPEEIGNMPWNDVLVRLAQAERILMRKVPPELTEPIRILNPEEQKESKQLGPGELDVNQLIKDGRKDAAQMGLRQGAQDDITDADREIGREAAIRHKRRAMARRFGG